MSQEDNKVIPFRVTEKIRKKRILRAAQKEADHIYHITGGYINMNQDPRWRELFDEGMIEL
jgi:hypothetical protein